DVPGHDADGAGRLGWRLDVGLRRAADRGRPAEVRGVGGAGDTPFTVAQNEDLAAEVAGAPGQTGAGERGKRKAGLVPLRGVAGREAQVEVGRGDGAQGAVGADCARRDAEAAF